jgi:hypothetical protein
LLSNLFRTKDHPTPNSVLELADIFSLTLDGAHRLFGYDLQRIREYDFRLNGGRTHINGHAIKKEISHAYGVVEFLITGLFAGGRSMPMANESAAKQSSG